MPPFLSNWLGYLANLTTIQICIGLGVGFVLLLLAKVIFTRGGPAQRMKGNKAPWVIVPVLVAAGGGIAWVVIKIMGPTAGFHL